MLNFLLVLVIAEYKDFKDIGLEICFSSMFLNKIKKYLIYVCVSVWKYVHMNSGLYNGPKIESDLLELKS